jgi:hypothetical protein
MSLHPPLPPPLLGGGGVALLLSLISTESVQKSTEKLPLHVVMMSLYIQDQVPRESYFLQDSCFYGQRRLCLALCILFSLYGRRALNYFPTPPPPLSPSTQIHVSMYSFHFGQKTTRAISICSWKCDMLTVSLRRFRCFFDPGLVSVSLWITFPVVPFWILMTAVCSSHSFFCLQQLAE